MSEGTNQRYPSVRVSLAPLPTLPLLIFLSFLSSSQASSCVRPFSIQHGRVNVTETNRGSFPVGTVLQYSCDSGYTVDGPSIVICTREGLWSSGPPHCLHINYCVTPLKPENGGYTCHSSSCRRLTHGTVIEYFCDEGYTLKGDYRYITCQNGEWDNSMQVSCVPTQECNPPFEPENGGYTCHPSPCHHLTQGSVVEYFCDEGYTLKGDQKYLTCQNGEWDHSMQVNCVPTQGCVRPFSIQHGRVNVTETNRGSFPVGAVLQYNCDSGYTVDGPSIVICTREGLWSSGPPRCLHNTVCGPPFEPENGGYSCHPSPCHHLPHGTVVEYFCDEGYTLKGDYKYLTCQNGEWDSAVQISCVLSQEKNPAPVLGMNTLSIVASTASSVALVLLLVVLFVLLQPKLKSFHHGRRDQGGSGQPVTIMVEGVQVTLPSYEEAVSGAGGPAVPRPHLHAQLETVEQPSAEDSAARAQLAEIAVVHRPPSSSSSSSSWSLDTVHGAMAASAALQYQNPESSQQNSMLSLQSPEQDTADDIPLLKES
ncbi:sushi domain-containing protein 4-like [Salminus brasiliensis]|uniref:sushi domain-containing protein 4-like n=1 Tax=Salminus brasiliensis TaxID=930266 RepID=UPI003B82FFA2